MLQPNTQARREGERPYEDGDVHPTVRCGDCGGQLRLQPRIQRRPFWGCANFPRCNGLRSANPKTWEPVVYPVAAKHDRDAVDLAIRTLVRDELCSRDDALAVAASAVGHRVAIRSLSPEDIAPALQALAALRSKLESARPVVARPVRETCCETIRDAYGAVTICWVKRRWCLGVAEHATRAEHTPDNEGITWGTGAEEDLREDAQAAFVEADSRRR